MRIGGNNAEAVNSRIAEGTIQRVRGLEGLLLTALSRTGNRITEQGHLHVIHQKTFEDIISSALAFKYGTINDATPIRVTHCPSILLGIGAFKTTYEGTIATDEEVHTTNILLDGSGVVAIKRLYRKQQDRQVRLSRANELTRCDMEAKILQMADALTRLVYIWMRDQEKEKALSAESRPVIPDLRFVAAGVVVCTGASGPVYFVEELITQHSKFAKYIGNTVSVPISGLTRAKDILYAEFLCFAQHVQYIVTGCRAFVSDYQGE